MGDEAALAQADAIFCDCPVGVTQRRLRERRCDSWRKFAEATQAENKRAAAARKDHLDNGVPIILRGKSLRSLAAAARLDNGQVDPAKVAALTAAKELLDTGAVAGASGVAKRSILIWGPQSGVGKTGCLVPIFEKAEAKGTDCLFISFHSLVEQVRAGFKDDQWYARLERARNVQMLFLDDLGFPDRDASDHVREVAIAIMRHRHGNNMVTLMTSNLSPDDLAGQLGTPLFRRVAEMAAVVEMGGKCLSILG